MQYSRSADWLASENAKNWDLECKKINWNDKKIIRVSENSKKTLEIFHERGTILSININNIL